MKKLKKLKDELDKLVKEVIKIRDDYTCQHCGKKVEGSNCHGSHVIPVSRGNALRWDELNLKTLCYHCHINWWHKNPTESGEWFKSKFPDRWAYLQTYKNEIKKFKEPELLELKRFFKSKLDI